jgi:hypothetical protein
MTTETLAARSATAWELARRQHGVLTRRDLHALGFSESAIRHRLATGRLHVIGRGVYAVGPLERLVNEADAARQIDLDLPGLRRYCDRRGGEPGVKRLRHLLDPETFRLSDSELERLFRPVAIAVGLPQPLTKAVVNGYEVDFYWPDLALVVEADSLPYHRNAIKQSRDLMRDQVHTAAGLTTLRFTHWQVAHDRGHVEAILASTRRACGR